jgi:hypothetical protein
VKQCLYEAVNLKSEKLKKTVEKIKEKSALKKDRGIGGKKIKNNCIIKIPI